MKNNDFGWNKRFYKMSGGAGTSWIDSFGTDSMLCPYDPVHSFIPALHGDRE